MMGDLCMKLIKPSSNNDFACYIQLKKDRKNICRMRCNSLPDDMCANLPYGMTQEWSISLFRPKKDVIYQGLPSSSMSPDPEDDRQDKECQAFLKFLKDHQRVAIGKLELYEFYIRPPPEDSEIPYPVAFYLRRNALKDHDSWKGSRSEFTGDHHASEHDIETGSISQSKAVRKTGLVKKIYAKTDPTYLKTLGQIHSGWIFGAVAELVDNSRDAKATTLKVSIEMIYSKQSGKDIPMLSVIDDGHGMTYLEILRMITFGHKQPDADDPNKIGVFGVGFKVQLDFSLRAYFEVMFLDPRMKIYVQGSLVNCRPLAKSLNKTVLETGNINGKAVQLILGRCQLEWEQENCGIFLYWHGRLVEAYKRVGSMRHNGDKSHGIIGVIDVSELMNDGKVGVWVHNNKQSFQDCEAYAQLEHWLGEKADSYLDNNFDKVQVRKSSSLYKPDHEWVQCDKCRKWRMLNSGIDSKMLPQECFTFKGQMQKMNQHADSYSSLKCSVI